MIDTLKRQHKVDSVPMLIMLASDATVITKKGAEKLAYNAGPPPPQVQLC